MRLKGIISFSFELPAYDSDSVSDAEKAALESAISDASVEDIVASLKADPDVTNVRVSSVVAIS